MEPTLGEIRIFAGNFAPRGWAFCHGQLLPIAQNAALFSILATTYGGNGYATFGLPDLRGRSAVQAGTGEGLPPIPLGLKFGTETNTLNEGFMPKHNHSATVSCRQAFTATTNYPKGGLPAIMTGRVMDSPPVNVMVAGYSSAADTTMNPEMLEVGMAGKGLSVTNMQPWLAMNYIIALTGTFPSRS